MTELNWGGGVSRKGNKRSLIQVEVSCLWQAGKLGVIQARLVKGNQVHLAA